MNKKVLREIYLEKRLLLPSKELKVRNQIMMRTFFREVSLDNVKYIHIFLPIETKKEPNTWLIIEQIKETYPRTEIVISRSHQNGRLSHYIFESKDQLKLNRWNIPEPVYGREISPEQIDLVLVPMVVFDLKGNRIGYGKGYYDRFLSKVREGVKKIGYSLTPPLDDLKYVEDTDIQLDGCITHLGFRHFA